MQAATFVRRFRAGVPYYACTALEAVPWLRHGFSTRHGGLSAGSQASLNLSHTSWDSPENVASNRRLLLDALDLAGMPLATLSQIHSACVHIIGEKGGQWNAGTKGDALVTNCEGVALGVQIADCFPILIADPISGVIACVHSGWKGTLARLLLKTINKMRAEFDSEPSHLLVAIGPGIRICCYEVGAEVADLFAQEFPTQNVSKPRDSERGKYVLDLASALRSQLQEAGVAPNHVHDLGACTRCNLGEFHSYRGDGPLSGRMMAVIAKKGDGRTSQAAPDGISKPCT